MSEAGLYTINNKLIASWTESGINNTCSNASAIIKENYPQTAKVIIQDDVIEIAPNSFYGCELLEEVILPNSVISIGNSAFEWCINLKKIYIPKSVKKIENWAFRNIFHKSFVNIEYDGTADDWWSISIIDNNNIMTDWAGKYSVSCKGDITDGLHAGLYDVNGRLIAKWKDTGICISCYNAKEIINSKYPNTSKVVISKISRFIAGNAFKDCKEIKEVVMPDNVRQMLIGVFMGCNKLERVKLSNKLKCIPHSTFSGCLSLKEVTLYNSIDIIDTFAFMTKGDPKLGGPTLETINFIGTIAEWRNITFQQYWMSTVETKYKVFCKDGITK